MIDRGFNIMLDISLKNLWQRRTRTVLTMISIAVCIMLFIVLATATFYMNKQFTDSMGKMAGQMYVKSPSPMSAANAEFPPVSSSLSAAKADEIMKIPGIDVDRSTPLLLVGLAPSLYQGGPAQVMAVGIPEGKEQAFFTDVTAKEGADRLGSKDDVILGGYAADYYKVKAGDTLRLMNRDLRVVGIMENSPSMIVNGAVMMPLSTAQDIFNRPSVTTVLLTAASVEDTGAVAGSVKDRFPGLEVMTQKEMLDAIETMMSTTRTFMGMINAVMLVVAGVVTLMVMIMSVSERTKEIGMLRAIGAKRRTILAMVVEESLFVCMAGSAVGIILSFLLMKVMFGAAFASVETIAQAVLFMTVIGVLAGLYPAYKASKVEPLEALRYE